jgi:hypothetical protein
MRSTDDDDIKNCEIKSVADQINDRTMSAYASGVVTDVDADDTTEGGVAQLCNTPPARNPKAHSSIKKSARPRVQSALRKELAEILADQTSRSQDISNSEMARHETLGQLGVAEGNGVVLDARNYELVHKFGEIELQEDDGRWRPVEISRAKRLSVLHNSESIVLHFGGDEYEGLAGDYRLSGHGLQFSKDRLLDGDGDEIPWRKQETNIRAAPTCL